MGYGNGNVSGASTYAGPKDQPTSIRQPMIADQMMALEQRAEGLHSMIAELEARLSAVLTPEPPQGLDKEGSPSFPVPLAASLAQSNQRLSQALNRLQALIGRIEL